MEHIFNNLTIQTSPFTFTHTVVLREYWGGSEWATSFLLPLLSERVFKSWGSEGGYIFNSLHVDEGAGVLQFKISHCDPSTISWARECVVKSEECICN